MQLLDTAALPPGDRADAVTTLMREIALASRVRHDDVRRVYMSSWSWTFGPVELVHTHRSGMFVDVTRDRDDCPPVVAIMLGSRAGGAREQFGRPITARAGAVDMIELNRPHKSWIRRANDGWCVKIPVETLALPQRTITRARLGMAGSPLQQVFAHHLQALAEGAPALAGDEFSSQLGTATASLARALISSAGDDDAHAGEALRDALVLRVQVFVQDHLRDPELTPAVVAAAHHMSVRQLYKVCAESGLQLEQFIVDRRLDAASWDLRSPLARHRSIAAIARQWGFVSPSHFHRRFREKYGVTPGEMRRRAS